MDPRKRVFFLLGLLLVLTGCRATRLQNGRYFGRERDDFAMVYKDLIFLRIRAPRNIPRSLPYWEWGGKYSVDPGSRRVSLDMERENARLWNFCYSLYSERGALVLRDMNDDKRFVLKHEAPAEPPAAVPPMPAATPDAMPARTPAAMPATTPAAIPRSYSTPGVDPVHQPLAPIN